MSASPSQFEAPGVGAMFEALFDFMPQLGWSARSDGFIDFYNRGWYAYTGTTYEQMQGWGWERVHDPQILPHVIARWGESLKAGTPFEMEFPLRRHDGAFRWFLTRVTPIRDAAGSIVRWVGINTDIDERKRAAQAAEAVHLAIERNMVEGVCLVRISDSVIVQTNSKFDAMLGYDEGELVGKPSAAIYLPDGSESLAQILERITSEVNRKGVAVYEVANARKDGTRIRCLAHTSRLDHPVFGAVWVVVRSDISARKRAEEERDGFFEMSLELLGIAGFDGFFKRLNPAWERTLGWTLQELMAKGWDEFIHPDDRLATVDAGNQLRSGLEVVTFVNRYLCKDGSYRWLEWKCKPVTERGVIYAAARDVTAKKDAELALRRMSENLETTLNSIAEAVISTDLTGAVVRMNPVAEKLTGWPLTEARTKPLQTILPIVSEDTGVDVENPVGETLRRGTPVALANRSLLRQRDGTEIVFAANCAPIKSRDGTVQGAVLVGRDLTAQRSAEAAQQRLQKQLLFADRMASVGTLAAGMAHEINNPLTYVSANVEAAIEEVRALSGGSSSARMRDLEEMLSEAREGVVRVTKIVRGLKTFSRIEEERIGVVDLFPVIELSINMAFNEIRHRARLVKDFGRIPLVDADDARLSQVFINLLVNAAQAFAGGSTVENEIRVVTSTDPEGRAVIEVRDSGAGIAPALVERIFDPFFTTKPVGVGTGLGLAISHNIVTGMGGTIAVQSTLGQGTTFRVVLPASTSGASTSGASSSRAHMAQVRPARVLAVDDEPAIGMAIRRVLRQHDVTVVTNAQDALDLLAAGKEFDVVLSDLMMPGMSGIEFYRSLVRLFPKTASRVVFVTGGAFTAEASSFLEDVSNERIEKPFEASKLKEMVQRFSKG